ncbi:MAG: mandelate racemase [Hyphomicrobiales bacterium]|nr:mandelate racemase [Hyphomicrobiales bacterium]
MKIERIDVLPVRLPLKAVVTLARGVSRTIEEGKQIAMVKITGDDGTVGWGEAGPSRRWSAETTHSVYTTIKHYLAPALIGRDPFDMAGLHAAMNTEMAPGLDPGQPVAKAAIDVAVHDLICRHLGISLQSWLGGKRGDGVELSRLVSASGPDDAAEITRAALAEGYRAFKVKVGHDPSIDVDVVRAVMATAPGCVVWPDANQGYSLDQALLMARAYEDLGVTVFEQPIPMTDVTGMRRLMHATRLTIVLDEAAMGIPYLVELMRRDAVEGIAIKVNKVGGLYYARQMCDLARSTGMTLIGSGLMDAPIGFAASVQLFAAYGIDFPVDLNGPQHIAEDYLAKPYPMDGMRALVPDGPGLGIEIDEDKVAAFALDLKL